MVLGLIELLLVCLVLGLLVVGARAFWLMLRSEAPGPARLPGRQRAEVAAAIAQARWVPGHDEIAGTTRILLRKTWTGLDGRPQVLEERVLDSFSAADAAWEARFTEAMSAARFRCAYLNAEETQ
jgi:hypothetical protein